MIAAATRLSVYFGDSIDSGPQPAGDALVRCFAEHRLPAVTLVRGIEGFGLHRRIHSERLPDLSTDLPLLATAIGEPAAIRLALEDVDGLVPHGLLTTEATLGSILEALIATIEAIDVLKHDGRALTPPPAPGGGLAAWRAVSVYTRRTAQVDGRPLYSELTRRLREKGAAGATTVLGTGASPATSIRTATGWVGLPATCRRSRSPSTSPSGSPACGARSTAPPPATGWSRRPRSPGTGNGADPSRTDRVVSALRRAPRS